jgi:hypothetical protein
LGDSGHPAAESEEGRATICCSLAPARLPIMWERNTWSFPSLEQTGEPSQHKTHAQHRRESLAWTSRKDGKERRRREAFAWTSRMGGKEQHRRTNARVGVFQIFFGADVIISFFTLNAISLNTLHAHPSGIRTQVSVQHTKTRHNIPNDF